MADKGHHHAHDSHYHVVFPVKYRKALLTKEIPLAIVNVARGIEERYEIEFEKIGTDLNHIHILCSFSPSKYKGGDVVRIFKSITARELFKRFPELKKDLWGGEFWSDGYYFATVGERGDWNVVKRYIENQGKTEDTAQLKLLT
ncbi:MAG: IS200/IS605 family transposase [Patescibacteria group bacterium]|nr:IS200/IS605 family transposase [Patescibacteria group bacterium]